MKELEERFVQDIYRPGEDLSKLDGLTDAEKSERRLTIESIFADPEAFEAEQRARYDKADEEAVKPVTIVVE